MAEITAKLVNDLRAKTGQGMMECKKMLAEAGGDLDKAVDLFRKKGVKASVAARATAEGRVVGALSSDARIGALVSINANTDFTAKSEPVLQLARDAAALLAKNPSAQVAADPALSARATEVAQKTGENVHIGASAVVKAPEGGKVGLYIYNITGKIGVLMAFTGAPSDELLSDLGGHIAFARPLALTREQVPADVVAKEREIAVEQAKATGKPQNIAEKIAEGKLNAFFKEQTLLDQDFFNPGKFKGSIAQYLKQHNLTLTDYVRVEVGKA
jgi:elongation factor Ts